MDNRPIGVFDSGIGGISVLGALVRELHRVLSERSLLAAPDAPGRVRLASSARGARP